jgi:hypothetical protein
MRSPCSVSVCVFPKLMLGNSLINTFPWHWIYKGYWESNLCLF